MLPTFPLEMLRVILGDSKPFIPWAVCRRADGTPFPEEGAGAYSLVVGNVFIEFRLEIKYD